jgi:hypothetical protein
MNSALYMRVLDNVEVFAAHLKAFLDAAMAAKSFRDPKASAQSETPSGSHIFTALSTILFEYVRLLPCDPDVAV